MTIAICVPKGFGDNCSPIWDYRNAHRAWDYYVGIIDPTSVYLLIGDFGESQNKMQMVNLISSPIFYCDDMYLC